MALAACGRTDGGLKVGETGAIGALTDLTPKEPDFTINAVQIKAPGQDVEVLRVRAMASPNVQLLGTLTTWPRDALDSAALSALGYPSPSIKTYHPAIGTVVPAAETAYVLEGETAPRPVFVNLGFRLASGEVGVIHAMEVTYRAGGETTTQRSRTSVVACMRPCSAKPEGTLSEWEEAERKELGVVTSDSRDLPAATKP
jgi:hypothetical protein